MSDEDIIIPRGKLYRAAEDDDFEEMLEILIRLAQSERREFLAYLLRMALIEARSQAREKTCPPALAPSPWNEIKALSYG
jgi:hypothetical protein